MIIIYKEMIKMILKELREESRCAKSMCWTPPSKNVLYLYAIAFMKILCI